MATTYRLRLSDGRRVTIKAYSAADAIDECLWTYRGTTVSECHSGMTREEAEAAAKIDSTVMVSQRGLVSYDIPPHSAVPLTATRPTHKRGRLSDASGAMFDDAEILAESKRAKDKR